MASRGWVTYETDAGQNVSIKVTSNTAQENGQTLSRFPTQPVGWGYNHGDLRHFCGVTADGLHRARMTVCSRSTFQSAAIGAVSFQDSLGKTFVVTSKIGEASDARDAR